MGPSEPHAPALSRDGGREVGRYVLYGEIASGGMATVHFGRLSGPVGFSRTVAIKRLHPQFARDPEFVTMFLDEARLAGRIRHPNVVPTLDVVATEGEIFLVMEYVQGESLSRLARSMKMQNQRIPPRMLATVMSGVLHGLHAAHEAKDEQGHPLSIVHRDVSPQNILVGTDGTARVLDFGVAKAAGRLQSTREGQIKGKISYMAPEQLNGGNVTRSTDIYAASVVLWECLVGKRLVEGDNEAMIVVRALEGRVEPPSVFVHGLPADVDAVVMRGLARDPSQRFATAREMALALERAFGVVAPSEIGEWVEAVAGAELTKRAATIADIESSSVSVVNQIHPGNLAAHLAAQNTAHHNAHHDAHHDAGARTGSLSDAQSEISQPRVGSMPAVVAPLRFPSQPSLPGLSSAQLGFNEGISQVSSISVSHNGRTDREVGERRLRVPLMMLLAAMLALAAAVGVVLTLNRTSGAAKTSFAVGAVGAVGATGATSATGPTTAATVDPAASSVDPASAPSASAASSASASGAPGLPASSPAAPTITAATIATEPQPASPAAPARRKRSGGDPPRHAAVDRKSAASAANCDPPYTVDEQGHKMYKMECLSP